ncbi:MAG: SH3 domain-containing protein [Janthinobacterium lividum]
MATLQDPDPFADPAFLDRFGKLLPMLGSGQANEADTARRKLLEHLGQHRLTLTDVATRIRRPPQAPPAPPPPARSAHEVELMRELDLVRHAQRASEQMARSALQQNAHLQNRASRAESAQLAAQVHRRGERIAMFAATALAVGLLAIVVLDHMPGSVPADDGAAGPITATMQPSRPPLVAPGAPAMADGERLGSVLSHDIAVRADPAPESHIVGFLAHGTAVVVVREAEAGGVNWVLVRSTVGAGYVPASSVAIH